MLRFSHCDEMSEISLFYDLRFKQAVSNHFVEALAAQPGPYESS